MNNEPCLHNSAQWFDKPFSRRKQTNPERFWFPTQKLNIQRVFFCNWTASHCITSFTVTTDSKASVCNEDWWRRLEDLICNFSISGIKPQYAEAQYDWGFSTFILLAERLTWGWSGLHHSPQHGFSQLVHAWKVNGLFNWEHHLELGIIPSWG